jgi:transcription initiation factor IIF auxiliary subunit
MTDPAPTFVVKSQVVRDSKDRIKFWQRSEASREHYHVGIWIEGDAVDLDRVDQVDYLLHPSFNRQTRTSRNRSNSFSITIWTWGLFDIHLTLHMTDGTKTELDYLLDYDLPPDDGSNYVQVESTG